MVDKSYPNGRGGIKSRYVSGKLVFFNPRTGAELFRLDPTLGHVIPGVIKSYRQRFTVAEVNAGASVLAAVAGFKYRMINAKIISVGGAAGAVTTVDVLGTQSASSSKLVAFAQASLTQNTVLTAGDSGAAVLAAGASYIQNDVNTAITIGKTGATITTATHFDLIVDYVLEP